ncbi:putative aryl-alcohol dehydrogenase AAD14 like protein [Verticillium longisporum]|uniref:Putative aryl-alcohol dehydrogenase AAD14 like protein n=1 Tax=Verticillium longisporum TaxID=100787 RepID=A0A8I3AN79_VERLO|nr:putative aryl-alcohol dehydrogenase AAD14 like protein [Verticillium longisporum]
MTSMFQPAPEPATELGRYRVLSSTAGVRVSPLCLGAMSIGEAWSEHMGSIDKEQSFKLLDAFHDAGGNFIDTANNYQNEDSETFIGSWMKERDNRDLMFIATKFTTDYRSWALGKGKTVNFSGNHKKSLHMSVRDSLRKLQTDYIDLLYVHWWDWTTSIEELMDSLHILVEQGKVLYLGASDTPAWVVSAANTYARAHGKTPFSIYQGREALEEVATEHGTESVQAIALAYVLQKTRHVFPMIGGRKVEHLKDNITALSIHLTDEQIAKLESVKEFEIGFPTNMIGQDPRETGVAPTLVGAVAPIAWEQAPKPISKA